MNLKKILIITGHYVPAYKDGGPIRSLINLVDYLGDEYEFNILTADRENGDEKPFENIKCGEWNKVGKAKVFYLPPRGFRLHTLLLNAKKADIIYVTGCYREYARKIMLLKRINMIKSPVFLASMGMFSPKALEIKATKKKLYLWLMRKTGMFKNIRWSVTSYIEADDLKRAIGVSDKKIYIAEDLPRHIEPTVIMKDKSSVLNVCFLSRISREKNLLFAIETLKSVRAEIVFTIYGPISDDKYWDECKRKLKELPNNVKWSYNGIVDSNVVVETLKKHDVLLLPTLGENYGHVIFEALAAGCPCIISDQTPWRDLEEAGIGKVIPLHRKDLYTESIESYAAMKKGIFQEMSIKAHEYAVDKCNKTEEIMGYRKIFDSIE